MASIQSGLQPPAGPQQQPTMAQMGQPLNPYQHSYFQAGSSSAPYQPHPFSMQAQAGPSNPAVRPAPLFTSQAAPGPPEASGSQPRPPKKRKTKAAVAAPATASTPGTAPQVQAPVNGVSAGYVMPAPSGSSAPAPPAAAAPAAPPTVVKRPRGRPRKNPLPPQPNDQAVQAVAPGSGAGPSSHIPPTASYTSGAGPSALFAAASSNSARLPPPTTLKDYVNRLNAHIESTKTREEGDADAYMPTGEWSADDKASFYPILARHSALRPDLIARDTGKSEAQVQQYLGAMQAEVPTPTGLQSSRWVGKGEWTRGIAPAAREIGEAEIREEEAVAAELLVAEEKATEPKKKRGKRKVDETTWGSQMDGAKLSTLSALVNTTIPADPLAGNKAAKLLRDEQALSALLAIPSEQRTATQQKEVRRLKDKKTMRMKYRHNKLISEGMTAEQITAQGGPDAIYLARQGPPASVPAAASAVSVDPLKGNKYAKIMRDEARLTALLAEKTPTRDDIAEIRRLTNKKRARQRIRKRKLLEEGMTEEQLEAIDIDELFAQRAGIPWGEEDAEEQPAVTPGLGEWVSGRGLDLWNYEKMIRGLGDVKISFDILDQLRSYLFAFLVPLMSKIIDLAEREGGEPNKDHVWLFLELDAGEVPEEEEGEEWEIQTTTTDLEEEELDDLLEEVDEVYDRVRETGGGGWDDPFCVEGIRQGGGVEARAKRKQYLKLLNRYTRRQAKRALKRERGGGRRGNIVGDSESLLGNTDEEDEVMDGTDSSLASDDAVSSLESEEDEGGDGCSIDD